MSPAAVVVRHDVTIGLGNLEPVLRERGYTVRYLDTAQDIRALDPLAAEVMIVLGGDMGAYDTATHPVLRDEITAISARLAHERPIFGVCLGAQLMASALGSAVYRGSSNEIGFRTVEPSVDGANGPLRHVAGVPMLQWHGDTFDLPATVTRLAGSPQYATEAFGIGQWALAVQFHPEVTAEMYDSWLRASVAELAEEGLDADALRAEHGRYSPGMQVASRALFSEWLDGLDLQKTS